MENEERSISMRKSSRSKKPVSLNDRHRRLLQDLSSAPKLKPSHHEKRIDDDRIAQFSGIADFDALPEKEKPMMVKIEGRRRLCKVSSRDNGSVEDSLPVDDVPEFSDINEFESPGLVEAVSGGGNEIRDILNDLTSKLDMMSIEKKRVPDGVDKVPRHFKEERTFVPAYANSGPSYVAETTEHDGVNDLVDENDGGQFVRNLRGDTVLGEMHKVNNNVRRSKENNYRMADENLASTENTFVSNSYIEESDGKHDDFFIYNGSRVEKSKQSTLRLNNTEPIVVHEKLRIVGRSTLHNLRDEEEDRIGEEVSNSKHAVKEVGQRVAKYSEASDPFHMNDESDNYTDLSTSEHEGPFTLTGPKDTYRLSGKIAKMLYPHQHEGLRWLWSLHCKGKGGILGDDMGLGKTMQICGFLAGLFHSKLVKRALVVAPKTLLSHWIKELSVVGLAHMTREYFGTSLRARQCELADILQGKGILLTTYDIVRNNAKALQGDDYYADEESEDGFTWDYMILDEGHLIKNPSTQRAKSLQEIPSVHRIVISGTPMQNNLKELWALFHFCCPDLLGDNKWFKERYENPILHGNDKNATDREKCIGSTVAKELREVIQPYFLRRLKNEVFKEDDALSTKLSKKNELIVWLRLTSYQRKLYEAFLQSELVLSAFDGSPLAALTILKKICDHPLLLTKRAAEDVLEGLDGVLNTEDARMAEKLAMHVAGRTDFQEKDDNLSCKISFIMSLLGNLIPEGHKVLIFSQTRKMLNLIQENLGSNDYKYLRIDGTTKASDRVKIVEEFQQGFGAPIFLLTSQVGGLGLTLTEADRVIVVDPAWNPSTDNQSVDRAYRIGQKKDVIVYRLMTCGTVEEKIYKKQIFKGGLFKTATEHKEQIRYFSQQDLRELFSLPKQGFDISVTQKQLHEEHDRQHHMAVSLKTHIKFLESQGIAGVSHHSLLFSKTAPVQVLHEEEEQKRWKRSTVHGSSSYARSLEDNVDGVEHAFRPKDVKHNSKNSTTDSAGKTTESEIKDKIARLHGILGNKDTVTRLPDRGERIRRQIAELDLELQRIQFEEVDKKAAVDVDNLTGKLQRVLNV